MDGKEIELDLSVFESDFDPHNRGKQCIRTIRGIQANCYQDKRKNKAKNPCNGKKLSKFNQQKLLEYSVYMIRKMKRNEFSVSSFEKNLAESWKLCLFLENKDVSGLREQDIKDWWEEELKLYEAGAIAHATLIKRFECCQKFLKWNSGLNGSTKHPLVSNLDVPRKPKSNRILQMPTQVEVKRLVEAVFTDGKKYTIRDQAILALANDSGARISEILSMRNEHIKPEGNYLVVSFPESKTMPRTVISFLAKPYLEQWAKISPNREQGARAFFFCQSTGKPISYNGIRKSFERAMSKTNIPWQKGKSLHFFRSLFSSRAYDWGYTQKHYWLGWAFKDHEKSYTHLNYKACIKAYFGMLKEENNPFASDEPIFWEEEKIDDAVISKLLEKDEFRVMVKQLVRGLNGG